MELQGDPIQIPRCVNRNTAVTPVTLADGRDSGGEELTSDVARLRDRSGGGVGRRRAVVPSFPFEYQDRRALCWRPSARDAIEPAWPM